MTEICLTISLSTHNGDDTPHNPGNYLKGLRTITKPVTQDNWYTSRLKLEQHNTT